MYEEHVVHPMRKEMVDAGFLEVRTGEEVDAIFAKKDSTTLFFVNSICGCAAGIARPGVIASLNQETKPTNLVTSFAGNDAEAVNRAREHFAGYSPSSPCAAVVREGQVVHMVERHHIEGQTADTVAKILKSVYEKYCGETIKEDREIFDPLQGIQIGVDEARSRLSKNSDLAFLDVREDWEQSSGMISGAITVNQNNVQEIISNWSKDLEIIVYCEHGTRSLQATQYFQNQGFKNIKSLSGGYVEWTATS